MSTGRNIALLALGVGGIVLFAPGLVSASQGGIVDGVPNAVSQLSPLADSFAQTFSILDPEEILAIVWNESTGNPLASNPGDPSWGLMGVTPLIAHAKQFGGFDPSDDSWKTDPVKNMKCGASFLSYLKGNYSNDYPAEWPELYNIGEPKFLAGSRNSGYANSFFAHVAAMKGQV